MSEAMTNSLYKIRRKCDGKFFSATNTWSEEENAKIFHHDYAVTSTLGGRAFMEFDLGDFEVIHYVYHEVDSKWASEWQADKQQPTKRKIREAQKLRNFFIAVILNGEYVPKGNTGETIPIPRDEDGWVLVEDLLKIPFNKHKTTKKLLQEVVKFGSDKRFGRLVFNFEEDKIKIVKAKVSDKPTEDNKEG